MGNDRKTRRLRYLIHKYDINGYLKFNDNDLIAYLDRMLSYMKDNKKNFYKAFFEIKKLVLELSITKNEYFKISRDEYLKKTNSKEKLKINNLKETRDNKGVYIGGGGSNRNKIRKPSKKRSKRTWRIFREMFPKFEIK